MVGNSGWGWTPMVCGRALTGWGRDWVPVACGRASTSWGCAAGRVPAVCSGVAVSAGWDSAPVSRVWPRLPASLSALRLLGPATREHFISRWPLGCLSVASLSVMTDKLMLEP